MEAIVISPSTIEKKAEVERLRQEFLKLYTEKDRLLNEDRDDLYVRYVNLIGKEKYDNFQLSVEVRALKMKVEMAQAALNRDERPNMIVIQMEVDARLQDYYKQINEQAEAIRLAEEARLINKYDAAEMQQLFRVLVKRLHPDLHPDLSEELKDLFIQGQTAYRTHNLTQLRNIIMRLDLEDDAEDVLLREETIDEVIKRLKEQIDDMKQCIEELHAAFPLNMRQQLLNPAWVHEQKEELKKEREELEQQKQMYTERLNLLTA